MIHDTSSADAIPVLSSVNPQDSHEQSEDKSLLLYKPPAQLFCPPEDYRFSYPEDPPQWSIDYTKRCSKGIGHDGDIDRVTGKKSWKCKRKDCPRHWAGYAYAKYKEALDMKEEYPHWWNIRLSTFMEYSNRINEALRRWVEKIQAAHENCQIFAVFHNRHDIVHIHILLGTNEPCSKDTVVDNWRRHCPYEKKFHGNHVWFTPAHDPVGCLKYFYWRQRGKTPDEKKQAPPWAGLGRQKPYQNWQPNK